MKRILLLSDLTYGGAAVSCRRLLQGLTRRGDWIETRWLAASGEPEAGITVADRAASLWSRVLRRAALSVRRDPNAREAARHAFHRRNLLRHVAAFRPDAITLHNLHESVSFALVERLPPRIPLIWTLHDMWPLTGYCCYSFDCAKYLEGCPGTCPQAGHWGLMPRPQDVEWRRRQRFYDAQRNRLTLVAPSQWLATAARRRFRDIVRVEWIPYGVDLNTFHPVADKVAARQALGLPPTGPLILGGAQTLRDERKGLHFLIEAARHLRLPSGQAVNVAVFGRADPAAGIPPEWHQVGNVRDAATLNLLYNAADLFVLPSLADNLPNTLLEALAAGTPSVAFAVGGCAEVVRTGETGFVAHQCTADALAAGILRALTLPPDEHLRLRAICRKTAEREYALPLQADRYVALWEELTDHV